MLEFPKWSPAIPPMRVGPRSQIVSAADPGPGDEIGAGLLMAWRVITQPSQTSSIHISIHISTISIAIHPIFIPYASHHPNAFQLFMNKESAVDTFRWWDRLGRCRSPSLCTGIQISIVTKLCGLHWTRWRVGSQKVAHGCTIMLYTMVSHLRFD